MTDFVNTKIKDIAEKNHSRVDPSDNPHTEYSVYSFSAHDEGKKPDKKLGEEIGSSKYKVPDGCILVTKLNPRIPRVWKVADCDDESIASTEFVILKPKNKEMLDYLYAVLSSDSFFDNMSRITGGTSGSHQRVKQSDILDYEFSAPVFKKDRKKISDLISAIDEKIRLNREISELLEEIAESIYVSWFEEYEPYKDRYDSLSGKLRPQFPISLEELGNFQNGNSFEQGKVSDKGEPIIKISELKNGVSDSSDYYPEELQDDIDDKYHLDRGDILLSWSASIGCYIWDRNEGLLNQHIFNVENKYGDMFTYMTLKNAISKLERKSSGTTMQHINRDDLKDVSIVPRKGKGISEYEKITGDIYSKILEIREENRRLKHLRDYLLPVLLSGSVDISDISTSPDNN